MSTKLDKNFGLGNSYKNVKLVKSAVKKVDSDTKKLIEELKAGTLPVYFQSEIGEEDLSTLKYPCLIYDGNGNLYFVDNNGDDRVYGFNIQVTQGMTEIYSMSSMTIEEGTSFNDWLEDANFEKFATENVVDQNKGTKLYKHDIQISPDHFYVRVITNSPSLVTYISQAGTNGLSFDGQYIISDLYYVDGTGYRIKYARAGVYNIINPADDSVVDMSIRTLTDTVTPL